MSRSSSMRVATESRIEDAAPVDITRLIAGIRLAPGGDALFNRMAAAFGKSFDPADRPGQLSDLPEAGQDAKREDP